MKDLVKKEIKNSKKKKTGEDLVLNEDSKEIQPISSEEKEIETDEHGRPVWHDKIVYKLKHKDLLFLHQTIRLVMEKGLVPPDEVGPCMTLLDALAEQESEVHRDEILVLPVNYFIGMWHALNTGRMFAIYQPKFVKKDKWLDKSVMNIAKSIDNYHKIKATEKANDSDSSDKNKEYFKQISSLNNLNLIEESKKPRSKKKAGKSST